MTVSVPPEKIAETKLLLRIVEIKYYMKSIYKINLRDRKINECTCVYFANHWPGL